MGARLALQRVPLPPDVVDAGHRRSGAAALSARLSRKPSSGILYLAFLLTLAWVGFAFWAGFQTIGTDLISPTAWENVASRPDLLYFTAGLILPVLMIWAYAMLVRRSQEMRLVASTMTEVAYRLIDPETEATSSVKSVGKAVRREIDALTDGIENAVSRASELETLVNSELSSLDTAHSANELRMRGLVEELANEREAIVAHSERVRSSIAGASETLREDLSLTAEQISDNVAAAQQRFSQALGDTNESMKESLAKSGVTLLEQLSAKGDEIGNRIESAGGGIVKRLDESTHNASNALDEAAAMITFGGQNLAETLTTQSKTITERLEQAGSKIAENLSRVTENATTSVDDITATFGFVSENLSETLRVRSEEIARRVENAGQSLLESVTTTGIRHGQRPRNQGQ